jgi:hypothetical protein
MQKKQGTLIKQTDKDGKTFYVDNATGKPVRLTRITGRAQTKMPDYVFRTFRKPAPTVLDRLLFG